MPIECVLHPVVGGGSHGGKGMCVPFPQSVYTCRMCIPFTLEYIVADSAMGKLDQAVQLIGIEKAHDMIIFLMNVAH